MNRGKPLRIKSIHVQSFKRFTDLHITNLPESVRLVVMAGPNGIGKSSLFDAFRAWHSRYVGMQQDQLYYPKQGLPVIGFGESISVDFSEVLPTDPTEVKKLFYIRSAYRHQPDFSSSAIQPVGSVFDAPKATKMIDNDMAVADDYQRLASTAFDALFSGNSDTSSVHALREAIIAEVRDPLREIFGDLVLRGLGNPMDGGSFFFSKGISENFHYKNLSGGEKAAFDLLLDLVVKRRAYDNTVYCIDEPETHMNTRLQARLLGELIKLVPPRCQLWIATHSLGMMRKARDLQGASPNEVVFLDFENRDFDSEVSLKPVRVDRDFWNRTLRVALDDLADLVAPRQVVLCEGRPSTASESAKADFDAKCYRVIFASEFPDTDFISVGNASDVHSDRLGTGKAIQTLGPATTVLRVVDRDDRSVQEIADLGQDGVRVLSLRHLEAYLLSDEVLERLCVEERQAEKWPDLKTAKDNAIVASIARSNASDDVKSAAGEIYNSAKHLLNLTHHGNITETFLRDTMAPLVPRCPSTYSVLKHDVFGL